MSEKVKPIDKDYLRGEKAIQIFWPAAAEKKCACNGK